MILKFWTNHAVNRNNINPWLLRRTWILLNFLSVTRSPAPLVTWRPTFWNNVVVSSAMFEMPKRLLPRNARYQIPSDAAPNLRIQGAWTATFFGGKVMYVYSVYSRKYLYEFCSELTVCIELLGKIREQRNTQTSNARWEAEKCRCFHMQDTARAFHHSNYTCNSYQPTGSYSHECTAWASALLPIRFIKLYR